MPWIRWLEYLATAIAILILLPAVGIAAKWPFVHDGPIIRYVGFLMENGFAPYRDIVDMQMPGSYLADMLVVHTLGSSANAWWAWDTLNGAVITLSLIWIAGKGRRFYGAIAAILADLIHLSDGPWFLGERDWTVAMLMALSVGCMFRFVRGGRPAWVGFAFLMATLAATIKPPALLLPTVLFMAICLHLRGRIFGVKLHSLSSQPNPSAIPKLILWALVGTLPPLLCVLLFLGRWHAAGSFFEVLHGLVPYYASLHRQSLSHLASMSGLLQLLFPIALAFYVRNRSWRVFEMNLLLLASVCGLLFYVLQGKGFLYHLYTAVTFLLLWIMMEIAHAAEQRQGQHGSLNPWLPGVALTVIVTAVGWLSLVKERSSNYSMTTLTSLQSDLNQFGGSTLSHHVQCLDMTRGGCINALYRMRLIQSTGTISDFYLFADKPTPVTRALQNSFLEQISAAPPTVLVLSSHTWPSDTQGYSSLANFPQFESLLRDDYYLAREHIQGPQDLAGYRLYVHK